MWGLLIWKKLGDEELIFLSVFPVALYLIIFPPSVSMLYMYIKNEGELSDSLSHLSLYSRRAT